MKIALFKIGAIGDTIMTTPLVRQLRKKYPHATIDFIIGSKSATVLKNNPHIKRIIAFDENIILKKDLSRIRALVQPIKKQHYDIMFFLDKHPYFGLFAKFCNAKQTIGFKRKSSWNPFHSYFTKSVFFDGTKHEIEYYLDLYKTINSDFTPTSANKLPELYLSKKDTQFANLLWKQHGLGKSKVIVIAPGGANNPGQRAFMKLWSKENYAELVAKLIEKDYSIILVGDNNDCTIAEYIVRTVKHHKNNINKIIDLTGKTTLQQTAAIMKKASIVICNDTGAMHIASAVNDRIVSIFGPTDPRRFAPLHKQSIYLWKGDPNNVWNDIYGNFKAHGKNPIVTITVKDVLAAVQKTEQRKEKKTKKI